MLVCIYHRDTSPVAAAVYINLLFTISGNISLSGGSSCKWYINPEVPEAKNLVTR
jgi:replication factor A1